LANGQAPVRFLNKPPPVAAALFLVVLAAGALFAWWTAVRADSERRADLIVQAQLAAQPLQAKIAHIRALSGTAADLASPRYQQLKTLLADTREANRKCRFAYLLGRRSDGALFFVADSEPPGSPDYSPPGQLFEEAPAADRRVFDTKTAAVTGPVTDRWGVWISALVPLTDPQTGAVVAVLGMDVDARAWKWDVAARVAPPMAIMLVLLVGAASLFAATRRQHVAPKPVLRRLLPPLAAMMLLLLGGAGILLRLHHQQHLAQEIATQTTDTANSLRLVLEQQTATLAAAAQFIAANARVQQALRTGQTTDLLPAWRPMFETLRNQHRLTHFNFISADRRVLLRVHQPERHGDLLAPFTLLEAERTGQAASGLEPGRIGVFTLRVVQPVSAAGHCVGYVELGKEIKEVLQALRQHNDLELAVVIAKERLDRQAWEAGMAQLGEPAEWGRLPHHVVIYSTLGRLPDAFVPWSAPAAGGPAPDEASHEVADAGRLWRISTAPLSDASGQTVGNLLVLRDISAEQAAFTRLSSVAGAGAAVLLALLLGGVYVLLRRTDTGIQNQQRELRENEQSYRNQFAHNSAVMMMFDPGTGAILDANAAAVRFYGHPRERLLALSITDINTLPAGEVRQAMASISPEQGRCFQFRHRLADGSIREVDVFASLIWFGGRFVVHSIIQDVTERKQAEDVLRKSEARFRSYFDLPLHGIAITSPGKGWLDVNDRACAILGYSREELLRLTWSELTHPDDLAADAEQFEQLLAGQIERYQLEKRFVRKDGTAIWTSLAVGCVREADGRVNHLIALLEDITERKRMEAERERLSVAIEQAAEIIVITDVQGTIQYVNPTFESVTGHARAEAIGQNMRILKSGQQDAAFYRDLWSTLSSGKVWQGRFVNRKKNGELYTEEACISPVRDAAGAIINYVAVKRDITAELDLTAQLAQAQKMEAVGQLAGGVAHDFNNILQAILGNTELALDQIAPTHPVHRDLEEIQHASQHAADLTRQLLAFARKQAIAPRILDLNATVEGVLKMVHRLIGENIELVWTPGTALWPVKMDAGQIGQMLTNLCVNARDAIAGVGTVQITTQNTHVDELMAARRDGFLPGDYVLLTVTDNGCGMDAAAQNRIFEPFYTTKSAGQGTGLGLATVYGIVRQNLGQISVYSEPGQGTTFRIHLPRHVDADLEAIAPPPAAPRRGDETVLLVEDDLPLLQLGVRMLQSLGYCALAANTPAEALRLAEQHTGNLHLLVTDVIMPGMNGRELATQLTARHPQLKCLFMSGFTADIIARQGILDKNIRFIQKPFTTAELAAKIREALAEAREKRGLKCQENTERPNENPRHR